MNTVLFVNTTIGFSENLFLGFLVYQCEEHTNILDSCFCN